MKDPKNQLDKIKSLKLLALWGDLPNPDHRFLSQHGRSPHVILRDLTYSPEIQSAILARESAVIGDPWQIISDSDAISELILDNLNQLGMNKVFREIFQAIWYGYTVLQHPMEKINGTWFYAKIDSLPSDWFSFTAQGELVPSNHTDTSPLNTRIGDIEKEVELVQYRPSFINPYGESLLARVFWSATWIRGNMDLWISYIDRFGDDSILGKLEVADDQKKNDFLIALTEFRSSGAMVVEGSDEVEILKTDKSSSSALFKGFHEICVQQVSKLVLGHASALEAQAGKLGNDQSLSIVRQDITQDDKSIVEEVINRLIQHFCLINNIKDKVFFSFMPEKEDERQRIERDQKLVDMGFELSEEYICKAYKFGEGDIKKAITPPVTNFSEDSENGKKGHESSTNYYSELDNYIENNLEKFKKPFLEIQKDIWKEIQDKTFWEDAFKSILLTYSKVKNTDDFALNLMRSFAIGQLQINQKIESLQSVNFGKQDEVVFDTFDEAKKFFTGRISLPYEEYVKLEDELKQYAFSVKGIVEQSQALELSEILLKSYEDGESFHAFKKRLKDSGLKDITTLTDSNLDLIYTQNMNNAYSYGRYKGLMGAVDIFPKWEYVTVGDKRVRPAHAALNGTIRRYDDPFWNSWYPPNGFKCRCIVEVSTEEPNGEGIPKWDKEHADIAFEKTGSTAIINKGENILPDKGFFTNKAQLDAWIGENVGKMAVNGSLLGEVENWTEVAGQQSLIKSQASTKWNPKTNLDIPTLPLDRNKGEDILNEMLVNHRLEGINGEMIFVNPKYLRNHFSKKNRDKISEWDIRSPLIPYLDKFLKESDEVWGQYIIQKDTGLLLTSKVYIKNVNGSPWVAIVESPKQLKRSGKSKSKFMESSTLPSLTTFYPLNNKGTTPLEQLKEYRRGVRLK